MKHGCVIVMVLVFLATPAAGQDRPRDAGSGERSTAVREDEAQAPEHFEHGDRRPGQSQRLPRAWEGAPPVIPHSLRGLTPITATNNACVRCHGRAGATTGPPPAPASPQLQAR